MNTTYSIRQSHLRILEEQCPAYAYAVSVEGLDGPSGPGAYRGQAVHDFFASYVRHLHTVGRQTDWDAGEALLAVTFNKYPALTLAQHDEVREQAENLVRGFVLNPAIFYGVEEPMEMVVGIGAGKTVRITGRLDYLEVDAEQDLARVVDVKSNHVIWPDTQVRKDFQLRVYAALVMANLLHIERVEGRLLMSRYGISLPQRGEAVWDSDDSQTLREHLGSRLAAHFAGKLKRERIPGTWCQYCPLRQPGKCTLHRSYYGTTPPPPQTENQARKLARQVVALEQAREARLQLLKAYTNEHGPLPVGSHDSAEVFGFHKRESEEIPATQLLAILEDHRDLVGDQPLDDLLTVNKRSKAFRELRRVPDLRSALQDVIQVKVATTFGHKTVEGGDAA